MPVKTDWETVNRIIHKIKKNLEKIVTAEKALHQIKQALIDELDELYTIIDEQVNGEK